MSQDHETSKTDEPRTTNHSPIKTVLKFDTGADGFQMMIYVLIICSVLLLGSGIYFILTTFGHGGS